ncbi:hypothetical protein ACHQM5_019669 [Ranunculus cassubicifolius]
MADQQYGSTAAPTEQEQVQLPPVLHEKKKKRIMVGLDESDESLYALKWTIENLFNYVQNEVESEEIGVVTLVNVVQPFQHMVFPAGPAVYATTTVIDSVRKAQQQNSAMLLDRALEICKGKNIKAESVILEGDPKDMICQAAEQIQPDMVVVGSRGLSKLKRAFLGSVSDYCAHHVKCPILIVKPPKAT